MAVQAQYPSNVLLLNNNNNNSRNVQEGHEYSLQPQPPGALGLALLDQTHHHQPHILCNNNNNNNTSTNSSRKRGRDTTTGTSPNLINHFSLHSQPSQIIHLSQLHNQQQQQQNVVSTGLRLSFDDQQQQQQRLQLQLHQFQSQQQQQQQQQGCHSSTFLSLLSQGLVSQIKQQRDELDQFIQAQGETLRRTLTEKRQRHYRELLTTAEEAVAQRLREKEAELSKATRKNAELEARAAQLTMEAQVWQAKARAQEAAAASLQAQLQQTIMCQTADDGGGGGVSCAVEGQASDAESAYIDPDRVVVVAEARGKCRACLKRVATVVVLPCRHLCICRECDAHYSACLVCLTLKNSTVEVFLS
ncbi:BOI-related E3 ubiquitin-protein ligase 1-like isoform X2 [Vicia villosa]|uniref:BOI-related E3 ubiquitin-protein ligase 1-like isoform X2 n=1 Tax=Vicia villosa TaxID=3911 RepID=UPI00273A81DF|nr:BOI-related E3 ubiquitin-protein ligase 1-like isoform X2 [Vicia villosa]